MFERIKAFPAAATAFLRRFFAWSDQLQTDAANRWRPNANRRTIVIILTVGAVAALSYLAVIRPPENFPVGALVNIPEGATLSEVSQLLEDGGVVRSSFAFRGLVMMLGEERSVRAGDYMFKEPRDVFAVAKAMAYGQYGLEPIRIRIPEGAMTKDMARIFDMQLERFNAENFLAQAQPMEGYLFPDTYFFLPNATEDTVIKTMRQNFDEHMVELQDDLAASGKNLNDVIILASILEREASIFEDRRKIAGVLYNRLSRGMPLQVDAVFLYTIGRATFDLTMADLTSDSPYNTYKNKGLPPTAIGSPSLSSLKAALNPIASNNLYYLADHSGVTHYSRTYQEHLQKKNLYLGN